MSFLTTFIDLLFPPHCVGCNRQNEILCLECLSHIKSLHPRRDERFYSALPYQDPIVKRTLRALKFRRTKDISHALGTILYNFFLEELSELHELHPGKMVTVIPVPLSKKRLRERGFNQSELIAHGFAVRDPLVQVRTDIAKRIKHTKPQSSIHLKRERTENMVGAFSVSEEHRLQGEIIIVIDDIVTTGSTIFELKKALRKAGARKIILLAVAH